MFLSKSSGSPKRSAEFHTNLKEEDDKANAEFEAKQNNIEVVKTLID